MSTKKNPFFEIKNAATVSKIFDVTVRHAIPVVIWLKNQSIKFETTLGDYAKGDRYLLAKLPPKMAVEKFSEALKAQGEATVMGSIQIDHTNFFFRAPASLRNSNSELRLEVPTSIYKLQRRADMRIEFRREFAPKVTFFDPKKDFKAIKVIGASDILAYRIIDISVGGLSFAAREDEVKNFKAEDTLHDMRFSILGKEVHAEGVIRHIKKTVNDRNLPIIKVGVKFKKLDSQYGMLIFKFILDESRKIFSLLK